LLYWKNRGNFQLQQTSRRTLRSAAIFGLSSLMRTTSGARTHAVFMEFATREHLIQWRARLAADADKGCNLANILYIDSRLECWRDQKTLAEMEKETFTVWLIAARDPLCERKRTRPPLRNLFREPIFEKTGAADKSMLFTQILKFRSAISFVANQDFC
jgi:hypothetical protein